MTRQFIWTERTWKPYGNGSTTTAPEYVLTVDSNHLGTILGNPDSGTIIPFIGGDSALGTVRLGQWYEEKLDLAKLILESAARKLLKESVCPDMDRILTEIKANHDPEGEILWW
jgi:hypothetical protein